MLVAHSHDRASASLPGDGTGLRTREIDNALMRRAGRGDRDAFAALYERHAPAVHGLASRIVGSPALAEEVTQDVFLTVWVKAPTFDRSRGSVRTWFLTIAHRRAVGAVRATRSGRDRPHGAPDQATSSLRSLDEPLRAAVQLAYFGGLTCGQVAERLDVPLSTARGRLRDGARRLAGGALAAHHEGRP